MFEPGDLGRAELGAAPLEASRCAVAAECEQGVLARWGDSDEGSSVEASLHVAVLLWRDEAAGFAPDLCVLAAHDLHAVCPPTGGGTARGEDGLRPRLSGGEGRRSRKAVRWGECTARSLCDDAPESDSLL